MVLTSVVVLLGVCRVWADVPPAGVDPSGGSGIRADLEDVKSDMRDIRRRADDVVQSDKSLSR